MITTTISLYVVEIRDSHQGQREIHIEAKNGIEAIKKAIKMGLNPICAYIYR